MVSSSETRTFCPSISFLFTRFGASVSVSRTFCPSIEGFVVKGSSLGVVLADLVLLLRQSVDWFKDLVGERRGMSEMRFSDLETGLSSSDDLVEMEEDIVASSLKEVRAFSALGEKCSLDIETFYRFSNRFQFPERVKVRCPRKEEQAYHFSPREVCFYEAAFLCELRFPVHPFIMELLNHFKIAPWQLMPNL